jgi:transcriptional regulator GlxA family with amidase domain
VAAERTVVFVAYDDFQSLDLVGPVEVLRTANHLGATPRYETLIATPGGTRVRSESGIEIGADVSLRELAGSRRRFDTVVAVGGLGSWAAAIDPALLADLAAISRRSRRTTSVCTGSFLLAAAGLLDGHAATTHWASCDELASAYPAVDVRPDQIFVRDRDRWTSAGVTAGIDLFLALVEDDHSADLALRVSALLVVFTRRPGGQSQFSAQLRARWAATPSIGELQRWLPDHLDESLTVAVLADRVGMSDRNFARAFRRETGITPAAFVESLRVDAARRLLESTGLTVAAIAERVGLRHGETLHRAFKRSVGTTPDRYRQHFGRRAS